MTQEVLKLALEALERSVATCFDQYAHQQVMSQPDHFINQAIIAIKEALREHAMREVQRLGQEIEQEPVACIYKNYLFMAHEFQSGQVPVDSQPLYTHPPQRSESSGKPSAWVGLTDEEVRQICVNEWGGYEQCRAIEAKLKEKNT